MSELQEFVKALKRQILAVILAQFIVIIGGGVAFYFNTKATLYRQAEINTERKEQEDKIWVQMDKKADKEHVNRIENKIDRHIEKGVL